MLNHGNLHLRKSLITCSSTSHRKSCCHNHLFDKPAILFSALVVSAAQILLSLIIMITMMIMMMIMTRKKI